MYARINQREEALVFRAYITDEWGLSMAQFQNHEPREDLKLHGLVDRYKVVD